MTARVRSAFSRSGASPPPDDTGWAGFRDVLDQIAATEIVVLDFEHAAGDDPRMGFALLTALGLENFSRVTLKPALVRDNAHAQVARRNLAQRGEPRSRSRELWSRFENTAAIVQIGRGLAPLRAAELASATFVEGTGCEAACQMVVALAQGPKNVDVKHNADLDDRLSGDEKGLIRLPHSGIEVTFPTVAYWPNDGGSHGTRYVASGSLVSGTIVDALRRAKGRGEQKQWSAVKPTCASVPPAPPASTGRCGESRPDTSLTVFVHLRLDETSSRSFLDSCAIAHTLIFNDGYGGSIAIVQTSSSWLERLSKAPFVTGIECGHRREPQ